MIIFFQTSPQKFYFNDEITLKKIRITDKKIRSFWDLAITTNNYNKIALVIKITIVETSTQITISKPR